MSVRALVSLATIALTTVLTIPAATEARSLPIETIKVSRSTEAIATVQQQARVQKELTSLARTISSERLRVWSCQDSLGIQRSHASLSPWALPNSIGYREWVSGHWEALGASCERLRQTRVIPVTNDWQTAVNLVQRIFPGTARWLLSCSSGEGSWGGFEMNHQGSGAGGWLQFMAGTYYAHNGEAFGYAQSRGFIFNPSANSWYSPLGQALTGAYLATHGGLSNWYGDSRCA